MYYEIHGQKEADAPTLVLISGLGGSANFWRPQLPALIDNYRVIVYDQLGTGRSPSELPSDYSIQHMAEELIALLEELSVTRCHMVGHALGGLVALQVALTTPSLLESIVLVNAWSESNPHTSRCFSIRKEILEHCSKEAYLQIQALLLYPPDWIANHAEELQNEEQHWLSNFPNKSNLIARIQALSSFNVANDLQAVQVDSLVIANKDDTLIPWQNSEVLAQLLPRSSFTLMGYGGHASTHTVPDKFNEILTAYLESNS